MMRLLAGFMCMCLLASSARAADRFSKAEPVNLTADGQRWVKHTLKSLSLEEKVGQMLNVRYFTDFQNFDSAGYQQFREQMQKYHLGSVVLTVHTDGPILRPSAPRAIRIAQNGMERSLQKKRGQSEFTGTSSLSRT